MRRAKREIDMLNGPLLPKILSFATVILLTNLLQFFFHSADLIVVGQFAGNVALGAVGATSALSSLFVTMFSGFSVGVSVVCSHTYGAGDEKGFKETVLTSMSLSLICGLLLSVLGFFFSRPILIAMNTAPEFLDLSTLYLKIYFLCMPAQMFFTYTGAVVRALGNTRTPLVYLATTGAANVVLNIVFVAGFGMSVDGVALATLITQYISAFLLLRHMLTADAPYRVEKLRFTIVGDKLKKILYVGVPTGLHSMIISFANIFIQKTLNSFSPFAVTGAAAAGNMENYIYFFQAALSEAAVNFIGQNHGAHKYDRIKKIMAICFVGAIVVGVVTGVGGYLIRDPFLRIFITKGEGYELAMESGRSRMFYICALYFLYGMVNSVIGILSGFGKTLSSTVISVTGFCGVRILWLLFVFPKKPTLDMLYVCYPISWAISFVAMAVVFAVACRQIFPRKGKGELTDDDLDAIKYGRA